MAAPEHVWPRRSSLTRSPDTLSPVFPDRPIRPLPHNRLRSKLSPEQADKIVYPPNPPTSSPLFSFPYGLADSNGSRSTSRVNGHRHASPTHCTCGGDHDDSEEEEGAYDHPSYRLGSPSTYAARSENWRLLEASRVSMKPPPPPASIASSADGYESFENTSNKKKRKIPLSGGSSVHQSNLSAEMANMGISPVHGGDGAADEVNGEPGHHYNTSINGQAPAGAGIPGAGRGRYGRQSGRSERRPLGGNPSSSLNGYASSLSARSRGGNWKGDGTKTKQAAEQGIISAAIASAADQEPSTPRRGKENISLLSQQSPESTTPKTQFTFTCESDSSNKMVWPGQEGAPYGTSTPTPQATAHGTRSASAPGGRNMAAQATQGTQTTPSLRTNEPRQAAVGPPPGQDDQQSVNGGPQPKPRRRRPSKEYAMAARQRRLQQEYTNYHHKPTKDSMWICEFCEYEDIYGRPPMALIRQYEIKDRAERKRAEEKRRLLAKAKLKNRKAKKTGKPGKNAAAQQPQSGDSGQPYDETLDNVPIPLGQQEEGDEYYDDEYDDGYDPVKPNDLVDPKGFARRPEGPLPPRPTPAG